MLKVTPLEFIMLDITRDIHSLTDFKRNTNEYLKQMQETSSPLVLTVNGKAELVVQDAASYQRMLDIVDRAEAIEGIRRGLQQIEQGEGVEAKVAFDALKKKLGVSDA
jgi:prevent-host-death family protein